jgi:hypothetical protein
MIDSVKINFEFLLDLDIWDKVPGGFVNSSGGFDFLYPFHGSTFPQSGHLCFSMGTPGSLYQKLCGLYLPF